jgi:hypothetical protein
MNHTIDFAPLNTSERFALSYPPLQVLSTRGTVEERLSYTVSLIPWPVASFLRLRVQQVVNSAITPGRTGVWKKNRFDNK